MDLRRRRLLGAIALAGAAVLPTGCAAVNGSVNAEIVPVFAPDRTTADVTAVRKACNGVGGATATQTTGHTAMDRSRPLRFDVTGLDDRAQAMLAACLSKQKSVQGFENTANANA